MTTQSHRLKIGGLIDRQKPLNFTFDNKPSTGFAGDTLASALVANGVRVVGRSFKYHRRRGILTAGSEEPNALVELRAGARREANTKATTTELYEGLEARSQNRWPSLEFDVMAANQWFAPLLVAGFYYKTFMWPAAFWEAIYEPIIRRAAGLGRAAGIADPDPYDKAWVHCDVLIVGAGPAGLAAALAAGRAGARVILCDEDNQLGGRLLSDGGAIDGQRALNWITQAQAELASLPDVCIMSRTSVFGVYDGGTYAALERVNDHVVTPPVHQVRQRVWRIVAKRCIVATGAIERPIVFPGNDAPGIMLASAMRTYLHRYAARPADRIALFTNNDDGWRTVEAALDAGMPIVGVVDARADLSDAHKALGRKFDFPVMSGQIDAVSSGSGGVRAVQILRGDGNRAQFHCDGLAMSGGWNPSVGLTSQHRTRPVWRDDIAAFAPKDLPAGMTVVGAAQGNFSLAACLKTGFAAGHQIAASLGHQKSPGAAPSTTDEATYSIKPLWQVPGKAKAFVDFQHDVTAKDVEVAEREGFQSVEHLKRYTTLGMATDQGRTSNVAGLAIMAQLTGRSIGDTGTTMYRPPAVPVAIGALAGHHRDENFHSVRLTPSHHWAAEQGAVFVDVGLWKRAQWFPRAGETDWLQSVTREVKAVRSGVGFCDVSTLGKIDVHGRDAGTFLDRVYINSFSTLGVGKARYGLMLREDGIVYDDGTTSRLAEDYYLLTTTTAKAGPVMQHLEYCRQVLFPELDVQLTSVTDQWAQFSIAGPRTRELLQALAEPSEDLSNAGFPFMAAREIALRSGMRARLYRISFSGELAFEIAVPARFGEALVRNLMELGKTYGVTAYGTEALGVMRIEKGHIAGAELNGTTTAGDLGMGKMLSTKKDFVGRVLAQREALIAPGRQVVVGVKPVDRSRRLRSGAHIIPLGKVPGQDCDQGYVTSVCYSPMLEHWLGLALVERGRERLAEIVRGYDPLRGEDYELKLCNPVFYDPEGGRQRA